MSDKRYLGNIITKNPTAPDGDFGNSAAKGVWSLEEQLAYQKAGLWPVPGKFPLNVEEVFSTYLYTGTNATQTITNGIDLDGEGGLVWTKNRDGNANEINHQLMDSEQGAFRYILESDTTNAAFDYQASILTPQSDGFDLSSASRVNQSGNTYASWTFRKAPKFFDVVTWTGNGVAGREIAHNLSTTVGTVIIKCTSGSGSWQVWHREGAGSGTSSSGQLNSTAAFNNALVQYYFGDDTQKIDPTSTAFTVSDHGAVNASGSTYVAYLFAHNDGDGEFGPDADADIIKCGSYQSDGNGSEISVDLGFEPQFVMAKAVSTTGNWHVQDSMRGMAVGSSNNPYLQWNTSDSESADGTAGGIVPTSNGFRVGVMGDINIFNAVQTYIYIAIRRGTAVPTSATDVFEPVARTATGATYTYTGSNFPVDMVMQRQRVVSNTVDQANIFDRLRGVTKSLSTAQTQAEETNSGITDFSKQDGYVAGFGSWSAMNWTNGSTEVYWNWKRAPKYMDVVAYTGNGTAGRTVSHNLGVAPEMMWVKRRNSSGNWYTYHSGANSTAPEDFFLEMNENGVPLNDVRAWNDTAPAASVFSVGTANETNGNGDTFIAYLFATLTGISKVGSVTHSGTTNVDCGFTSGARFVLLKRTDATGDWYVWDSTRGIVSGNDPYLLLNTTGAEVTNTDYIDPLSSGFTITSSFTAGDYIFYAIA